MRHLVLIASVLLLSMVTSVRAQDVGSIRGTVVDEDGKPVPGATVRIVGTAKGGIAKERAEYVVGNVPVGEWEIWVTAVGHHEQRLKVAVTKDSTVDIPIVLQIRKFRAYDVITRRCPPIRDARYGTATTITFGDLESSARPTLFGGGF